MAFDREAYMREYRKNYYAANRDRILAKNREWGVKNPERARECRVNYEKKNASRLAEYHRNWKKQNPERVKELGAEERLRLRLETFSMFGSRCAKCGIEDHRVLQIDHINQCSDEDRNSPMRCGMRLYRAIRNGSKDKSEFQVLCANCNWIKRYENGEHN